MTAIAGPALAAAAAAATVVGVRSALGAGVRLPGMRGRPAPGFARAPGWTAFQVRVQRSGIGLRAEVLLWAALGVSAACAASLLLVLRNPVIACLGLLAGPVALRSVLAGADRRHLRRVGEAMPAVAQMLAGSVAAGLSLRQAIIRAARDTPEPLGAQLRRASGEMELGARVDDALSALAARMPDPDLALLVTAILVQRRTGGDLARALRDMSGRLEERGRLARELRGATAQARATAWMVAGLPVMGAALAEAAAPGLIARTASSAAGLAVIVVSVFLQALGIVIIRRIAMVQP